MKTIRDRAKILLDALELYKGVPEDLNINAIIKALKEQDKITRHACAKSLIDTDDMGENNRYDSMEHCCQEVLDYAHQVVINTKTI